VPNEVCITLGVAEQPANGRCTVLVAAGKSQCMLIANSAIYAPIDLVLVLKELVGIRNGACQIRCISITPGVAELYANGCCTTLGLHAPIESVMVSKEPAWIGGGACQKRFVSH